MGTVSEEHVAGFSFSVQGS